MFELPPAFELELPAVVLFPFPPAFEFELPPAFEFALELPPPLGACSPPAFEVGDGAVVVVSVLFCPGAASDWPGGAVGAFVVTVGTIGSVLAT